MRRAALFVYHSDAELCRPRVELLRRWNPGVDVHALYGGDDPSAGRAAGDWPVASWSAAGPGRTPWQRYAKADLVLLDWYLAVGPAHPFDVLHVVQWDLLLLAPLTEIFAAVPPAAVGLTGLVPLERIAARWSWTRDSELRVGSERLIADARARFGFRGEIRASLGPGSVLPRRFLDRFAAAAPCEEGHDELRLPLYADLLGFELRDTGLYRRWFDPETERLFNADDAEIDVEAVVDQLRTPDGRRAFHPCRSTYDAPTLRRLAAAAGTPGPAPR